MPEEKTANSEIYAMYLRKSRADVEAEKLGEGETLARHRKILTELALRQGLNVGKIFCEIVSGETIAARPEIQKLMQECYMGFFQGIIIVEVTRLSRGSQGDAQAILDCLKYSNNNHGLKVVTPTKTYDVAHNQEDEEYMEFELFLSRREYKMIQKRMDRGKKQAIVEGNYMAPYRPYGYDIVKTKTSRTLVPNADEAPIVKKIFNLAIKNNLTPAKIAHKLDVLGVPTYTGEPEWSGATIREILKNPVYAGKVRWNYIKGVKTLIDGNLVTKHARSTTSEHYMLYDGKHKANALVSEDDFNAAASKFRGDKTKNGLKLKNLFAGVLVCANCKKAMIYQSYTSPNSEARFVHRRSNVCKVKSATVSDVTNAVIFCLSEHIKDFEVKINNPSQDDEVFLQSEIETLNNELWRTEKKLTFLFDAWENETISTEEFTKRKLVNSEKLDAIKQELEKLQNALPKKCEYEEKTMQLKEVLKLLASPSVEAATKNAYLKNIIEKIEFSRDKNDEIVLNVQFK